MRRLGSLTTDELRALTAERPVVALVPVGSIEPHGPHLPLDTDTRISEAAIARAGARIEALDGKPAALLAPAVPYGVTDFAEGFPGALSIPADTLTAFARAVVEGLLGAGCTHVCLVNNHLEPAHDGAVRAAIDGLPPGRASVACPLTRRWGRTLSAEYRQGNCHAGRYETSIILAAAPTTVRRDLAAALPPIGTSLAEGIRAGAQTFAAMGLDRAYTGDPASATAEEGEAMLERLATMVVTEVEEGLAAAASRRRVVFATSNPHKVREVASILAPVGLEVVSLDAFEIAVEEPVEDADTFAGNARIKARAYAAALGLRCLAEDSGLEVDALDGAPGVYSARYAGAEGDRATRDAANNEKLLRAMGGIDDRAARFVCAMCLADPDGTVVAETRGTFEGTIVCEPRGEGGFGYDPLLWLADEGRTSAELTPEEKNARSHRGHAARAMADALRGSRGGAG